MNKFAQHYIKHAFEEQPASPKAGQKKDPSLIVKSLRGLMAGAGIGAGVGIIPGLAYGAGRMEGMGNNMSNRDKEQATGMYGLLGAGSGALAGGLIGAVANPLFN